MSKVIPLSRGRVAIVDDADYEWLSRWKWCVSKSGYAVRNEIVGGHNKTISMHREILNPPPHLQVDHRNNDKLDNRRENLRTATNAQNQRNQGPDAGGTSHFKGVSWDTNRQKWRSFIEVDGHRIFLGRFTKEVDAAQAYNRAAHQYFGEFAYINPIKELL